MNSTKISNKAFLTGLIIGGLSTYIPVVHKYLDLATKAFYTGYISPWAFAGIWGAISGLLLLGSYAVYLKEGWWGLVRVALVLALLIVLFWIFLTSSFGTAF